MDTLAVRADGGVLHVTLDRPAARNAMSLRMVDELVDHRTITPGTWQAAEAHFDQAQILEVIALVGFYHTITFLCRGLDLPLEPWAARFPALSA